MAFISIILVIPGDLQLYLVIKHRLFRYYLERYVNFWHLIISISKSSIEHYLKGMWYFWNLVYEHFKSISKSSNSALFGKAGTLRTSYMSISKN